MLRYDNHVHMNELAADPDKFLKLLEAGGMTGANVRFVNRAAEQKTPGPIFCVTAATNLLHPQIGKLHCSALWIP